MIKSFKVRIYPNKEQKLLLEKTFGANRFIYNYFLNLKTKLYEFYKINLSYNNSSKVLTELKKQKTWLKQIDSISLVQTLRDLDKAYQNFFTGKNKYPNFKKKQDKNSYRTNSNIKINNRYITISKIGMLRYRDKYKLEYKAKWYNKTVSKIDRFYPSSQLCSECGFKNSELKDTSICEYDCPECGTHHDRDINAAINILNEGLRILESSNI